MSDPNLLYWKTSKKWNVVLLVSQGLPSADPESVKIYTDFTVSLSLDVKVRLRAILNSKRGRGVCVRACLCVCSEGSSFFI